MNRDTILFKGAKFAVEYRDSGRPVVFLHGFLEDRSMWYSIADRFAKHFNPILIDLPGHGESENLGYAHKMELMADVVHHVLRKLKKRKTVIVGHSMGGYVALAFADKYPDMLKGLALVNSSSRADSSQKKHNRSRGVKLCQQDHLSFVRQTIPLLFNEDDRLRYKYEIKGLAKQASKMSKQGIIAALEGMKVRPSREIILKFPPYPILFVAGKRDPLFSWKSLEKQMTRSNMIKPLILQEGGHMSFIENEDHLYKGLRSFLYQCLP